MKKSSKFVLYYNSTSSQMNPTVSVIVPTYNRAHCLPRALDSILNQTHPINEIIVVDDGSNDNTYELLKQHYPQINYHFQTNQGVSTARNYGIQLAQSNFELDENPLTRVIQQVGGPALWKDDSGTGGTHHEWHGYRHKNRLHSDIDPRCDRYREPLG